MGHLHVAAYSIIKCENHLGVHDSHCRLGLTEVEFLASGKIFYSNVESRSQLLSTLNQDNDTREISSYAKYLGQWWSLTSWNYEGDDWPFDDIFISAGYRYTLPYPWNGTDVRDHKHWVAFTQQPSSVRPTRRKTRDGLELWWPGKPWNYLIPVQFIRLILSIFGFGKARPESWHDDDDDDIQHKQW